ncbi:MAG: hypothetical protein R3182_07455, partial [Draconibacterium sp.]|nr:hypothetical protein [Draconibacterium sp.]
VVDDSGEVKEVDKSIAVLPFKSLSTDPEKQYLADGVMDTILLHLSKINDLRVISRTSVEQYRDTNKTINNICEELEVSYLLEGSFQKYGDEARLIAQLIQPGRESHVWANDYDRNWKDIFAVQSEVAQTVAGELKAVITPEEKQLIEKIPTTNMAAYEEYLKARTYWGDLSEESLNKELEYLNRALEKDPDFAPVYAGLAQVWVGLAQLGYATPEIAGPKIYENLNKALELAPDFPTSHFVNAGVAVWTEWDWEKGEKEFLTALKLDPNDALCRIYYAQLLMILRRYDEAHFHSQMAYELDPMNSKVLALSAMVDYNGKHKQSLEKSKKALEINPGEILALVSFQYSSFLNGDEENSIKTLLKFRPELNEVAREAVMNTFKEKGYTAAIETMLTYLEEYAKTNFITPTTMGEYYYSVGNLEKAIECYEMAFEMHDPMLPYFTMQEGYGFDDIKDDPRIISLVKKMNLPILPPE